MSKPVATGAKVAAVRSRLTTERNAVTRYVAKLQRALDTANGLWRYWQTVDITENHDEWAAFSDAVDDHLAGKPVPKRFLK